MRNNLGLAPAPFAEAVARARNPVAKPPKKRGGTPKFPPPTEKLEQRALFRWAMYAAITRPELHDLFAIPNAGGYVGGYANNMQRVQAMKLEGVRAGVPDICLPHARGIYHALYIELKRVGATASAVSDRQTDWHTRLAKAGNKVAVCLGWEAARDVVLLYIEITQHTTEEPA